MSGLRIHRLRGPREARIGEATDGHRDHIRFALRLPEYGRAADRAKMKQHRKSALGGTLIGGAGALHQNVRAVEESRYSERGTGSPLTGETMAERDQLRLRLTGHFECPTIAACRTRHHRFISKLRSGDGSPDLSARSMPQFFSKLSAQFFVSGGQSPLNV